MYYIYNIFPSGFYIALCAELSLMNTLPQANLLVMTYITNQKSSKTVKNWPHGGLSKSAPQTMSQNPDFCEYITPVTGVPRGRFFNHYVGHNLLCEPLKSRIPWILIRSFLVHLKVLQNPKFQPKFD